jgi:pheromone receptor transcription factor
MAFRRPPSGTSNSTSYSYSNTAAPPLPPANTNPVSDDQPQSVSSPTMRKRQRTLDMHPGNSAPAEPQSHHPQPGAPSVTEDAFINDQDAVDSGPDDDDDEEKPKSDKKAGRRKIKIEFIQDKSRRHITFSKRKAGMSQR